MEATVERSISGILSVFNIPLFMPERKDVKCFGINPGGSQKGFRKAFVLLTGVGGVDDGGPC